MNIRRPLNLILAIVIFTLSSTCYAAPEKFTTLNQDIIERDFYKPEKLTLIIFWASWCPTCISEMPELKQLHTMLDHWDIIGANVNIKSEDGIAAQKKYTIPFPSIHDPKLVLADRFNIRGTPGFIIINTQGEIALKTNRLGKTLYEIIDKLNYQI